MTKTSGQKDSTKRLNLDDDTEGINQFRLPKQRSKRK